MVSISILLNSKSYPAAFNAGLIICKTSSKMLSVPIHLSHTFKSKYKYSIITFLPCSLQQHDSSSIRCTLGGVQLVLSPT